ncbi:MAG: DUF2142 domain-containing protein [Butyrivibrio hungatei]|nr:DUF2142 domain-containing protein [Butyrivibrio hungatei]
MKKEYLKIFGVLIWTIILLWLFPLDDIREYTIKRVGVPAKDTLYIYGDNIVTQKFSCDKEFNAIELAVSFYDNAYYSDESFTVKIYDENHNCIRTQDITRLDIEDEYISVSLPYTCQKNKMYMVEISAPTLEEKNSIVLKTFADSTKECAVINSVPLDSAIGIAVYKSKTNILILAALILCGIGMIIWVFDSKHTKDKKSFILIMLLGSAYMLCITPYSVPDEQTHYYNTLRLTNIILHKEDIGLIDVECVNSEGNVVHINANSSFASILKNYNSDKDIERYEYIYADSQMINLIIYIFPAMGVLLGRVIGGNFLQIFYLGRLFNLLIYAILTSIAIKIIPKNEGLLFLLATFPICLQQGMSYSYDSLLNGLSFLFIAYVLYVYEKESRVGWEQILYVCVLSCVLTPIKIIYIVLLLFVLIIPVKKFENRRDRNIKFAVIVFMNVVVLLLADMYAIKSKISGKIFDGYTYTLHDLFNKPIYFLHLFSVSFFNSFIEWGKMAIGSMLSGNSLVVPEWIVLGFAILFLVMLVSEDKFRIDFSQKLVVFFTILMGTIGIMVAAFAWTPYGMDNIGGMQGRYFIPFILPSIVLIRNFDIIGLKRKVDSTYLYWCLQIAVIVCIGSNIVY